MGFVEKIAPLIQKYAPQYGIKVCSPVIAQAVLESANGTSELAIQAHNYFGLKYRAGRCPTASGTCYKTGSEQNGDGSYTSSVMEWCKFPNAEAGVQGYFDFINVSRYADLKGVTDPREYLERIKADGYATSLKYVDNLMAVIKKYDLTKYDTEKVEEEKKGMKILLSVGHSILRTGQCTSADGRPFGGVLEYAYNKAIVEDAAAYLRSVGHTVDLLICPELRFAKSSDEKPYKLNYENAGNYDLVAELHLNASNLHNIRGSEVQYYSEAGKVFADRIQAELTKVFADHKNDKRDNLYMLTKTKAPAVMIESFFCDSSADCELAEKTDVALLIAQGIHGGKITVEQDKPVATGMLYKVQAGAFRKKENADRLLKELQGKGFDAFIATADVAGLVYRVQVGAYSIKANAEAMQGRMQMAGYGTFIV